MKYEELIKELRDLAKLLYSICEDENTKEYNLIVKAADSIEELLKAAKSMHTWIFLNSGDEQAAYDECGLSDEMNVALGYGGQFVVETPKEE